LQIFRRGPRDLLAALYVAGKQILVVHFRKCAIFCFVGYFIIEINTNFFLLCQSRKKGRGGSGFIVVFVRPFKVFVEFFCGAQNQQ
jgi:hypothetical protein